MIDATLFNCCTGNAAPDWTQFDALEIGGCITLAREADGETFVEGGIADSEAEFWTVYGHFKNGGCEAITDCATRAMVDSVASRLSELSGLPVR
jgi:hypothetical protein